MHYHGHRERLRARFRNAPSDVADYELLELLLGYVILRRDTKPIAKELISRFHTLRGVIEASPEQYQDIPGVGKGVADYLSLLQEVLPRYAESRIINREELCDPEAVARMARQRLGRLRHEEIWVAYVDNGNRLISWEKASQGSISSSLLNPRDIIERALAVKAGGFIVVHNHPGGHSSPSGADLEVTSHLDRAARTMFLRFIDHVIVSDSNCYSIKNEGFLD